VKTLPLFLVMISISACGSLLSKRDTEDYNVITYGDAPSSNAPWGSSNRDTSQRDNIARSDHSFETPYQRNLASENEYDPMDPTKQDVREGLEAERGIVSDSKRLGGRTTKRDLWDNKPADGSLWFGQNDVNFFFTKSKARNLGDIVSIKIQENLIRQVADELKRGLTPAEQKIEMALLLKNQGSGLASSAKDGVANAAARGVASVTEDDLHDSAAEDELSKIQKAVKWSQVDLSKEISLKPDEEVRAEVIERYANGNFKLRATRPIFFRGRQKLVSIVGIAPATDFDEQDQIPSGKLYEYQVRLNR
jgi:flagellar basal body L-ring protein FlgH